MFLYNRGDAKSWVLIPMKQGSLTLLHLYGNKKLD